MNLPRDAHALLLDAPGGLFLACTLRLGGTAFGLGHIRLMRAEAIACRRRRRDQAEVLNLDEKRHALRDRRAREQDHPCHRQRGGDKCLFDGSFGGDGEQRDKQARRRKREPGVDVLERAMHHKHE